MKISNAIAGETAAVTLIRAVAPPAIWISASSVALQNASSLGPVGVTIFAGIL
jgi:hypothetical protein